MATCVVLAWGGIQITAILKDQGAAGTGTVAVPYWIPYLAMPIGLLLSAFYYVERIVVGMRKLNAKEGKGK